MIHNAHSGRIYDTAIVGAGVLGLWAALHAARRGEKVIVLEKRKIGAGASGGFLGALMPHMPDNWNAKKQMQFDGLESLEHVVAELEEETGIDCGYRRCGRVMPVTNEKLIGQIERRILGAKDHWQSKYSMSVSNASSLSHELNPEIATHGIQHDTLSARINPRQYLMALGFNVRKSCDLKEGADVASIEPANDQVDVVLKDGSRIVAGNLIVANGYEAYELLRPFMADMNNGKPIGRGVKGQAVLLEYKHDDTMPVYYHDGSYIVPQKNNRIAIGSTSVNDWSEQAPDNFDYNNMDFYHRAIQLVPALKDARIIDRWAGVRPRNTLENRGTEPFFETVPGQKRLHALIGGFKITLGIAHLESNFS
jgi:glycine/D-amino acid oxidase-like deaminating enzyme